MRLATIRTSDGVRAARVDGEDLVLLPFDDVGQLIASGPDWAQRATGGNGARVPLAEADFAPVTPWPEKIFCVGLNYADHAVEANLDIPEYPTLFSKYARSLIGADDNLVMPTISQSVDWEIELGVIIGAAARNVDESEAEAAVAGYTIVNDVSMRDWQLRTSQWLPGKTLECSTPVGPFLVTPDEVDHARALEMTLTIDGEVMQSSSSDKMVFSVGKIISYISAFITLAPGDLICTGTMSGVGHVRQPPVYLKAGNVVSCTIEGLGSQTTRCVAPSAGS